MECTIKVWESIPAIEIRITLGDMSLSLMMHTLFYTYQSESHTHIPKDEASMPIQPETDLSVKVVSPWMAEKHCH